MTHLHNVQGFYNPFETKRLQNKPLKDLPIADASLQYRIESKTGYVDFAILNGELCAHAWQCPKEGRRFLKVLEEYAGKNKLKLTIPTVLNPALVHILKTSGYKKGKVWVDYMDDWCELWSKGI